LFTSYNSGKVWSRKLKWQLSFLVLIHYMTMFLGSNEINKEAWEKNIDIFGSSWVRLLKLGLFYLKNFEFKKNNIQIKNKTIVQSKISQFGSSDGLYLFPSTSISQTNIWAHTKDILSAYYRTVECKDWPCHMMILRKLLSFLALVFSPGRYCH